MPKLVFTHREAARLRHYAKRTIVNPMEIGPDSDEPDLPAKVAPQGAWELLMALIDANMPAMTKVEVDG